MAVADYVKLFSADTLASTQQAPADLARNLAFVGERVALDLTPLATGLPGLDLKRTELLQLNGRPLAQVAYLHVSGQTVAFCVLLRPEGATPPAPTPPNFGRERIGALNIVHWNAAPHGLLLIGELPADELETLALGVARRLG